MLSDGIQIRLRGMRYKVTMSERQKDGSIRTLTQYAVCGSVQEVIKFYGLDEPDIVDYKIEKGWEGLSQ